MQNALRSLVGPSNACQKLVRASQSVEWHRSCCIARLSTTPKQRWCCTSTTSRHRPATATLTSCAAAQPKTVVTPALLCSPLPTSLLQDAQQVVRRRGALTAKQRHLCIRSQTTDTEQANHIAPAEASSEEVQEEGDTENLSEDLDDLDEEEMRQMLEEDEESTSPTSSTANTEWGSKGLSVAEQVLQKPGMQELALFSFITSPTGKQLKIRLDKPSDEYGSPSLDELSEFSRAFADEYSIAMGAAADDVAVEVSSPGAERQVRLPQDLLRFQHLPMSVTFQLDGSEKVDTKVLDLVSFNEDTGITEWKLSDIKQNRTGKGSSRLSKKLAEQRFNKPLLSLQTVHLHLEV